MSKVKKDQRIAELERKLVEALAGQAHTYHYASHSISKASKKHLMGSGVVMTLTALGGREIFSPVLLRDGLSDATIESIKADIFSSYELATLHKPQG